MVDKQQGIYYGIWMVAGCFVLLFLFAGAGFYSFSIFIGPLEESFGWSRSAISLTMSIYMLLHGISAPWVGHLTEAYGPKKVMTTFAAISGAAFILVSFTTTLWFFYMSYALLAIGSTGIGFVPVSSLLSRWFNRKRGTAIGAAMVGISVGGLVMAPLVGWINARYGWRLSFVFIGILVWVLALPITLFVIKSHPQDMGLMPDGDPPTPAPDSDTAVADSAPSLSAEEKGWPLREALWSRAFFWIAATYFLVPLAQMGMLQHQVPMIVERGLSTGMAATALGLTAGLGGLGKLTFGRIAETIPFRYAAGLCFGLQALAVFSLLNAQGMILVWIYVMLFGFAMGGVIVLMPLAVGQFFGMASFGVILGGISFVQAIGTACGAVISGLIYDTSGSYRLAMIIYIGLYIAAVVAIQLTGRPDPRGQPVEN